MNCVRCGSELPKGRRYAVVVDAKMKWLNITE